MGSHQNSKLAKEGNIKVRKEKNETENRKTMEKINKT